MRKTLLGVIGAILSITPAIAQPLEELSVNDTIRMRIGEARIYQFEQAVNEISIIDPIAEIKPQSDHTFTFRATSAGSTIMTAYNNHTVVYRARITVEGHLVKIFGQGNHEIGGYAGYLCTSTGCGRANPDVERGPDRVTVTDSHQDAAGNTHAVEKEYNR